VITFPNDRDHIGKDDSGPESILRRGVLPAFDE
jgi:hypothetical protein